MKYPHSICYGLIKTGGLAAVLFSAAVVYGAAAGTNDIAAGPFQPDWQSLKRYECPEWFRDAKFGIWSVWGPQAVPEQGDWYARKMYVETEPDYQYHVAHYGHPSKFGYKDIIALWKAEKWDPARLMELYRQAGAKYFVVMANHHDNYDLWDSKYQPVWNSVKTGPHKDIVGLWRTEALKAGLRFGVTEHNARSLAWLQTSHGADTKGPLKGVPYDGADPRFVSLYHPPAKDSIGYPKPPSPEWANEWYLRSKDLLDTYKPDLFYFDGGVPFGDVGLRLVTHYYNANAQWHGGKMEAVLNVKNTPDPTYVDGTCVRDVERGVIDGISRLPWQTDTCVGDWFYKKGITYKSAGRVIHMLADIVSKNGNLLLNAPLSPEGTLDPECEATLRGIGEWLAINGTAIYGTRPFTVFGEGPHIKNYDNDLLYNEDSIKYTYEDLRFTTKGDVVYVISLGQPTKPLRVVSLGRSTLVVDNVTLLGSVEKIKWHVEDDALLIEPASTWPTKYATVFVVKTKPSSAQ